MQHAVVGKAGADGAGCRIERDQPRIGGREIDPLGADAAGGRRRIRPVGDAAAGLVLPIRVHAGVAVILPFLLAGRSVERDRPVVRRAGIKRVLHLDWRHLIGGLAHVFGAFDVAGLILPGHLEAGDILGGDLIERRIALAKGGAAVLMPFA
ncbi:hypothetical protein D3C87_1678970 [compost metagenome]